MQWNKLWKQAMNERKTPWSLLGAPELCLSWAGTFPVKGHLISSIHLCNKILQITHKIGTLSSHSFCGSGIHRLSQSSFQGCNLIARVVWGTRPWFRCFLSYWLLHRLAWTSSWKFSQLSPEWRDRMERKKRQGENTNVFNVGNTILSFPAWLTH